MNSSILVVDDDLNLLEMISDGLEEHGYNVYTSAHPEDALKKIKEIDTRFALVDYDLCVPGLNGIELSQRLRFYAPDIIIIIMTGYANIKYAVEAMRSFKFDYMIKPFRIDQIISAFERSLREYDLIEENKTLYRTVIELENSVKKLEQKLEDKENRATITVAQASKNVISSNKAVDKYKKQKQL